MNGKCRNNPGDTYSGTRDRHMHTGAILKQDGLGDEAHIRSHALTVTLSFSAISLQSIMLLPAADLWQVCCRQLGMNDKWPAWQNEQQLVGVLMTATTVRCFLLLLLLLMVFFFLSSACCSWQALNWDLWCVQISVIKHPVKKTKTKQKPR